jgi:pimeloyl-ACP methyl ester carboxylesterase
MTPTVLLVHGAFADASSWAEVIAQLQASAIDVSAPANPLRGVASDAGYIAGVARGVSGPVLLAGHAYGGAVVSVAAGASPNVVGLVFVGGFALDEGESCLDLLGLFGGSLLAPALRPATFADAASVPSVELYVKPESYSSVLGADLPSGACAVAAAAQRPVAAAALEERCSCAGWKVVPSWYAVARDDQTIPADAQRFMASRAGAETVEVDASHAVLLSQPAAVADLIRTAALATSGS